MVSDRRIAAAVLLLLSSAYYINGFQPPPRKKHRSLRSGTVVLDALVEPQVVAPVVLAVGAAAVWWTSGADERARRQQYAEIEERNEALRQERARLAYIEPREGGKGLWTEEELAPYDGSDETGPLLFAADGDVFNVWKGRHFYGPGCEYHIFAGRDATRLLAKSKLEEETEEEKKVPLTIGERAALAGWIYIFKTKYDVVGRLNTYDPKETAM